MASAEVVRRGGRSSPLEGLLRAAGATMVHEWGLTFANDFGSVVGEVAACRRGVGVADRSDLVKLELHGPAEDVADVVEEVTGARPDARRSLHAGRAWWCPVSDGRVLVLCDPSHCIRLVERLGAAARARHALSWTDVSAAWVALAVVGPRAEALLKAVTAGTALPQSGGLQRLPVAGAAALLLREGPMRFIALVAPDDAVGVWHALHGAGERYGVASVGREAHERFEVSAGLLWRQAQHSH